MQTHSVPPGTRNPRGHTAEEILAAIQGRATYQIYDSLAEETGMTLVIVNGGKNDILVQGTSVDFHVRLFTNDPVDGLTDEQIAELTETDFTEATFTGYTARLLTGGSWTVSDTAPIVAEYTAQAFVSTISQTAQDLYGYYVTRVSTGGLRWFEYFDTPVSISGADEFITVTPRLAM